MSDLRVFGAPLRYLQGAGAIDELGGVVRAGGSTAVVLLDAFLAPALQPRIRSTLGAAGVELTLQIVEGEVTQARIDELAAHARRTDPEIIVAVGGGKTLDLGKGVARAIGRRIVTVPTIASNDGPTSRVIALYDEQHRLVDTPRMDENPFAVVVDTQLICNAPAHYLLSGIGDALAKQFEAAACSRGTGVNSHGTRPLELAGHIAATCHDVILSDARAAVADVERREVSPALERVVEAVVLMSGLAFENGGLSLAHSMTRGLMALPGTRDRLHGHQVAYALLVQLAHEGDSAHYATAASLFRDIGLPTTLADLGAPLTAEALDVLCTATLAAPHLANCDPPVSAQSLTGAIRTVENGGPA